MPVLYHMSLQRPTAIVCAVQGNFSAPRAQEIIVSRGRILELLRPDDQGKIHSVLSTDIFGIIRTLAAFRLTGATRDYVVIGSDSGRIVIVEYNNKKNVFEQVHCETYGKTGIRRIVPGEYLAVDPKGRTLMIGAVEKQKFVYILNRDSANKLTISSPLEAHKSHVVCHDICGVDMGFENPMFASLEQNYDNVDKNPNARCSKGLCFWEMDLGLNHVIKKVTLPVPDTAHLLIPVPGGGGHDGPSGVIVCCENFIIYRKIDHEEVVCAIPRRLEMGSEKGVIIVSFAVHRMKDFFFILIQSEFGDIYKIELSHDEGFVREIICRYFDTVPVSNSLCVLKSGYLFIASEFSNHMFYQFTGIGTDESDPRCSSNHPLGKEAIIAFKPRPLKNLVLIDELNSLSPITDLQVIDAQGTGSPQVYALCGRGPRSTLRILLHGLGVEEMADNELPGKARSVWTLKESVDSLQDGFIIVGFEGSSLVLKIGETVEEVVDTVFDIHTTTIHIALMSDDSYIQVLDTYVRHIYKSKVTEWKPPGNRRIKTACTFGNILLISLSGGELILFNIDSTTHTLYEIYKKSFNVDITCMAIQQSATTDPAAVSSLPSMYNTFVAVGGLDNIVRVFSVDIQNKTLKQVSTQLLPNNATPESVILLHIHTTSGASQHNHILYLHVGLNTGVMLRCVVDPIVGTLSDQRTRFLGGRAVRFSAVKLNGKPAVLALSEKTWLGHIFQNKYQFLPLNYDPLESVASFTSEQCTDGFVAIAGGSLRIFRCQRLGEVFSQSVVQLPYTPRAMAILPHISQFSGAIEAGIDVGADSLQKYPAIVLCEADHNAYDENTKVEIKRALKGIKLNKDEEDEDAMQVEEAEEDLPEDLFGTFKAGPGKWGSCIHVINPLLTATIDKVPLDTDEAAISCICCEFDGLPLLVVGTITGMQLRPKQLVTASIKVFAYDADFKLTLLHSTPVEDVPHCFSPYRGLLLAGIGNRLRLYSLGKKKLLKKCEYKNLPRSIVFIYVVADRIFVGDSTESVHILKYRSNANLFHVLCDDTCPRWLTRGEVLDYHTIACADKFDSIFVSRVPSDVRQDESMDVVGLKLRGDTTYMTDKCHKLTPLLQFHVGETVTGLQRAVLSMGGAEVLVYGTVMGTIGCFVPFLTKEELDFFHHLEMVMRTESPPLCGREHITFRSYYHPVKNVVDGDLCEQFLSLSAEMQSRIAKDFEKAPSDIIKRIEDIRNRVL